MPQSQFYPALAERVHSQRKLQPSLYGGIDFDRDPYRFTTSLEDASSLRPSIAERAPLLANARAVELLRTATLLGDVVADPYASLMGEHSFKSLIDMLQRACRHGLDAVPNAPPELIAFIHAMEQKPHWLDMALVREGARLEVMRQALITPYLLRGVFVATFMNKYAALPMALTGALGSGQAARRVKETAIFFGVTTLPGALDRHGPGFEAAAMVRLMHSMVRYHALKRSDRWDPAVYGIPIPQADQIPAGLITPYLLAVRARREGRTEWNARERAIAEFSRYRCFLLGLPEEMLPSTPEGIITVFHTRRALLRDGFDDDTNGALVRGTMAARLRTGDSWLERAAEAIETSCSKAAFIGLLLGANRREAARIGVTFDAGDALRVALAAPFLVGRFKLIEALNRLPILQQATDAYAQRTLQERLAQCGRPEFTTDASTYAPSGGALSAH